jgi:hypothetical protein
LFLIPNLFEMWGTRQIAPIPTQAKALEWATRLIPNLFEMWGTRQIAPIPTQAKALEWATRQ